MKRLIYLFIIILFLCGCGKKQEVSHPHKEEKDSTPVVEQPIYQDNNHTPISFYQLIGNQLKRVHTINNNYQPLDDIGLFQIYPSNEEEIILNTSFAEQFYQEWSKYNINNSLKIGLSLDFSLKTGENYHSIILSPNNTMDNWEYFMGYLYDDYANIGKGFYSHIENDEFNESTLFTAFKLQCGGYCQNVSSPIHLKVFSYDSSDDFVDNQYIGNSFSEISICLEKDAC